MATRWISGCWTSRTARDAAVALAAGPDTAGKVAASAALQLPPLAGSTSPWRRRRPTVSIAAAVHPLQTGVVTRLGEQFQTHRRLSLPLGSVNKKIKKIFFKKRANKAGMKFQTIKLYILQEAKNLPIKTN